MSSHAERNVGPRVDKKPGQFATARLDSLAQRIHAVCSEAFQIAGKHVPLPKLNKIHATLRRFRDLGKQALPTMLFIAVERTPVGDVVKDHESETINRRLAIRLNFFLGPGLGDFRYDFAGGLRLWSTQVMASQPIFQELETFLW